MNGPAPLLWMIYAVTGLPLTVFGYLFTGGGLPKFSLLDDWSNPFIVLAWALGAFFIFVLPGLCVAITLWSVTSSLRDNHDE